MSNKLTPRTIFDMTEDTFNRLKLLAQMLAASSFNNGNHKLRDGDFFLIMLKGMEIGMKPLVAVDFINVIKGVPVVDGKGMLALINSSGLCESIAIDAQDTFCDVTMQRVGMTPHTERFTLDDAKAMGLLSRSVWQSQPRTMLKWRAVSACARVVFPDILGGLYTPDEIASDVSDESDVSDIRELLSDGIGSSPALVAGDETPPVNGDSKQRTLALLNALGATTKEDYDVYLEALGIARFGDFDGDEAALHAAIRDVHETLTTPIADTGVGIADSGVYTGQYMLLILDDDVKARWYGRGKLLEALGEHADGYAIANLEATGETVELPMMRVTWEKRVNKTGDSYIMATGVTPLSFDEDASTDKNPFKDLPVISS